MGHRRLVSLSRMVADLSLAPAPPPSQQATVLDKTLKFCQDELDKLTSFETMPINVDKCSDVMTTVTAPFYNECILLSL